MAKEVNIQISKSALDELERLKKKIGYYDEKIGPIISFTPQCEVCEHHGCFHEDVQAWVCCDQGKNSGCGRIILTMKEYQKRGDDRKKRNQKPIVLKDKDGKTFGMMLP